MTRLNGLFSAALAIVFAIATFAFAPEALAAHTTKDTSAVAATDAAMKDAPADTIDATGDTTKMGAKKAGKHHANKAKRANSKAAKKGAGHAKKSSSKAKKASSKASKAKKTTAGSVTPAKSNIGDTMQTAPAETGAVTGGQ